MSKKWKFIVAVSLILVITLFTNEENIHACLCLGPFSPAYELEHSDAIFRGEVISKSGLRSECDSSGRIWFRDAAVEFKVNTVWKGEVSETTIIATNYSEASCGYTFRIGEEYIVYAGEWYGGLRVGLCSRTHQVSYAQADLEFLGEGRSPEPGLRDATQFTLEPRDGECPAATPDPSPVPSKPEALPATGGCAPLAPHARLSFDTTPLLLAVGIIWLTTRTRRRR